LNACFRLAECNPSLKDRLGIRRSFFVQFAKNYFETQLDFRREREIFVKCSEKQKSLGDCL